MAVDCLHHQKIDIITLIPPYVEEMAQNRDILKYLSHEVETVMWAGGDVSLDAGEAISSNLQLFTSCGSTETGLWPILRRSEGWHANKWKFMKFHPAMNMRLEPRSEGIFQAYIVRNPGSEYEQPVFKVFPTIQEYDTGDLFSPDPLDSDLWQYRGRADDIQVFLSGEMYHPTGVEQLITQHADVQEALLIGTRRTQAALLLEMKPPQELNPAEQTQIIDNLWPQIEEANERCPAYAKVTKRHILFTRPGKPMARSAKGSVQRHVTVQQYEEELNELFETATAAGVPAPPTAHSLLLGS